MPDLWELEQKSFELFTALLTDGWADTAPEEGNVEEGQ